jgi:hypothetical protein
MKGQPAKYIKTSEHTTVFGQPVIITFKHIDLKTNKQKRILNIGQDQAVDLVQIQILKELITFDNGWLNLPKAFYAKTRRAYNLLRGKHSADFSKMTYHEAITQARKEVPFKITLPEARQYIEIVTNQNKLLDKWEQGGFYELYSAFEYIVALKPRSREGQIPRKDYSLLALCEKCAPAMLYNRDGNWYFRNKNEATAMFLAIQAMAEYLTKLEPTIGIAKINMIERDQKAKDIMFTVYFVE